MQDQHIAPISRRQFLALGGTIVGMLPIATLGHERFPLGSIDLPTDARFVSILINTAKQALLVTVGRRDLEAVGVRWIVLGDETVTPYDEYRFGRSALLEINESTKSWIDQLIAAAGESPEYQTWRVDPLGVAIVAAPNVEPISSSKVLLDNFYREQSLAESPFLVLTHRMTLFGQRTRPIRIRLDGVEPTDIHLVLGDGDQGVDKYAPGEGPYDVSADGRILIDMRALQAASTIRFVPPDYELALPLDDYTVANLDALSIHYLREQEGILSLFESAGAPAMFFLWPDDNNPYGENPSGESLNQTENRLGQRLFVKMAQGIERQPNGSMNFWRDAWETAMDNGSRLFYLLLNPTEWDGHTSKEIPLIDMLEMNGNTYRLNKDFEGRYQKAIETLAEVAANSSTVVLLGPGNEVNGWPTQNRIRTPVDLVAAQAFFREIRRLVDSIGEDRILLTSDWEGHPPNDMRTAALHPDKMTGWQDINGFHAIPFAAGQTVASLMETPIQYGDDVRPMWQFYRNPSGRLAITETCFPNLGNDGVPMDKVKSMRSLSSLPGDVGMICVFNFSDYWKNGFPIDMTMDPDIMAEVFATSNYLPKFMPLP